MISYGKVEPRKANAIQDSTRSVWQPVCASAAKDGKILAWSAWRYVFPRGTDAPLDLLSTMTFDDLPSAVRGYLANAADFQKVHPNANFVSAVDELRDPRRVTKTLVSRIIASVSKNVTRQ